MDPPGDEIGDTTARANLIHREILQLTLLGALAVAAFFVTRAMAASNRAMNLRDGMEWYQRGERQFAQGDIDGAIDSYRRAAVNNRREKRYVFALAKARTRQQQYDTAQSALLELRETSPEDPEINLQLARLAVERQDVTGALRYYHNTLYAPWPAEQADARRDVRLELIDFLLTHDQVRRAQSELLALSTDLPTDPAAHIQVGRRFTKAGDGRHALDQFQQALRAVPHSGEALAGAGEAAFQLGDYPLARRYLRSAPETIDGVTATRDIVEFLLANDPLASRLGAVERRRRLVLAFSQAHHRFADCLAAGSAGVSLSDDDRALHEEAPLFGTRLEAPAQYDQDTFETGLELINRLETAATRACPPASSRDRALLLMAHAHGVDSH